MNINPPVTGETYTPVLEESEKESAADSICKISSIVAYLNKVADDFYLSDKSNSDRKRQLTRTDRLRRYMMADHNGTIGENGDYDDLTGMGDEYFFDPKLNTYLATIMPELLQAQTKIVVRPKQSNEIKFRRVAEFLQKNYEDWLTKTNTINKRQRAIKWNLLPAGDTYRFLFLNEKRIARMVEKPVGKKKQVESKVKSGKWNCPECDASGLLSDLDMKDGDSTVICPQCHYQAVKVSPSLRVSFEETDETETVPMFDLDFEVPDANEITVIWTDDEIGNALAVIRTKNIARCLVEEAFPNQKIPKGNIDDSDKPEYFSDSDDNIPTNTETIRVQWIWLNPSVYRNARTTRPEQIRISEGKDINVPKDSTILKEIFRDGLHYIRAGEKTILQTYEQSISSVWTHTVNEISSRGYGTGEWELLELQYQKNEARTQRMQKLLNDSTEPIVERGGFIDSIPNQHGARIVVNDAPPEMPLNSIVTRLPSASFPAEATEMERQIDGDMQARLGAMATGSADMPDMNAVKGTAQGYRQYQNHTLERRRPLLQMMADNLDCRMFYQYWKAFRDYQSQAAAESYFDNYPKEVVEWFYEMDVERDFEVTVLPNSFMPKTTEQRQIEFVNRFQIASALYQGDETKMAEVAAEFEEVFGSNLADEQNEEQTEAQLRLDKVIEAAQRIEAGQKKFGQGVVDANGFVSMNLVNTALAQATKLTKTLQTPLDPFPDKPIDVLLDEHEEIIDVYQDYLRSSNGRQLSQFVRMVIKALIVVHSQAAPQKEIYIQGLFNQITSANNDFQLQEQAKAQQSQMQMQQLQAQQDMGLAAQQGALEQEQSENQMMNQIATKQAQNQADLAHQEAKGSQQIGLEVAKQAIKAEPVADYSE